METNIEIKPNVYTHLAYNFSGFYQCLETGHTVYKTIIVSHALIYLVCYFNL